MYYDEGEKMEDIVVKVDHISKSYRLYDKPVDRLKESWGIGKKCYHKDHFALKDINFEVKRGECLGIIGTNGSGKSTLLKIITGVLSPLTGEVTVNGKISALLELGTGFNMEYTGIKNIYLNGTMMGYSKQEMDNKIDNIIEFAEIGEFINQPVKTYSSGMFARLAFAVAINVEPDILIVDEALSVGDIFFQAKCYKKFNEFQEQGKTILFVSHDLSSVLKYCNKCLLINKGEQIALGDTADVVNVYRKILVQDSREKDAQKENILVDADKEEEIKNSFPNTITAEEENWKERMIVNNNFVEYGNNKARIIDFGIEDDKGSIATTIMKGSNYKIKFKIHFMEKIKDPIFAYTIKDLKGVELTGTNTMLEGNNIAEGKPGDVVTVAFKQKMLLQGGQYLLSIACTGYEGEKFVVYHRLYDICNVHVISEKNTIGVFDNEVKVSYE